MISPEYFINYRKESTHMLKKFVEFLAEYYDEFAHCEG